MEVYRRAYTLRNADVDQNRRLRWDTLFILFQEAALAQVAELGFGPDRTLARGFLWVIALQQVRIMRLPVFGETITLETILKAPGSSVTTLMPGKYRLSGQVEISGLGFQFGEGLYFKEAELHMVMLNTLPLDKIKIDKSFVRELGNDDADPSIIKAIIQLAHSLNIEVIAEGVENRAQEACLIAQGCSEGQGWFLSTYQGDGSPLPSFAGEPLAVTMPEPEEVWQALNPDNKVSLYTNVGGVVRLFNKNLGD